MNQAQVNKAQVNRDSLSKNLKSNLVGGVFYTSFAVLFSSSTVFAEAVAHEAAGAGHASPVQPLLLALILILIGAKIGGDLAIRLRQPEVLGELVMGVLLGNLGLLGFNYFDFLKHNSVLEILSELGVILLLFEVGLETSLSDMMKVGLSSLVTAVLGVIAPFFLGWAVAAWFAPDLPTLVHIFVGATLTATSVGITARVLKDLGKISAKETKIILGAAVIDDVLGLLVLAVVSGIISAASTGAELELLGIAKIITLAVGFLVLAIVLGKYVSPFTFKLASRLQSKGILLATSLSICFALSYLAGVVGLAPIVGAFAAGLILEPVHYRDLSRLQGDATIDHLISPIAALLVPVFFILMGARVDITVFGNVSILGFAFWLTVAAILGKQVCAFGVLDKGIDRFVVGLGMIPRGEVGLIFASIGASLKLDGKPVVDASTFGAVIIMVIVTTMVTPPLVKWRFGKSANKAPKPLGDKMVSQAPEMQWSKPEKRA